jgi:hypothetical protein
MKERRDYMFTLVRQWRDSGLTRKEFCLQHGITMAKFGYWTRRWKEDQLGGDGGFIPMGSPVTGTFGRSGAVVQADCPCLMFSLGSSHRYYLYGGHCDGPVSQIKRKGS